MDGCTLGCEGGFHPEQAKLSTNKKQRVEAAENTICVYLLP